MPYRLSDRSKRNLVGVHPDMVAVVKRAIEISPADFMVIEGVRTPERQAELYAQGRTKPVGGAGDEVQLFLRRLA